MNMIVERIFNNRIMIAIKRSDGAYFQVIISEEQYRELRESNSHWLGAASEENRFMDAIGKGEAPGYSTREILMVPLKDGIAIVICGDAQSPTIPYEDVDKLLGLAD